MSRVPARARVGLALLVGLGLLSLVAGRLFPEALASTCPLGMDPTRPDRTVCELAFGGLWVSLAVGLAAGALSTLWGLAVAAVARLSGGAVEQTLLRAVDAVFALPDVLVVMVLQLAGQSLSDAGAGGGLGPFGLMVVSLALVGWAGPARMFRNRLATLESQEYVAASRALGGGGLHLLRVHLWPALRPFALAVFLSRLPAAILTESTVSFFGIARMEPMSLGRYLGTSYAALIYEGGGRVVLPAWALLVLLVLGASLASQALSGAPRRAS
ncbi:ABC transporter permease subunit [Myxococcus sp. AM009]|uniref:ABC transporter permease subunit n=1 Tax=unclassified Myxococcus TaxID=2648731 RepID=UPI0015955CBE|nr:MULTISPECIES: ABC transporter permease subunit [unclassified Myxococcus]NVJ00390.1 ABC transporter permease subunit [Myxococcus sp. AM009]NVJ16609.1 ABC transporter permease subunit [Myxococcus sp. AM010]